MERVNRILKHMLYQREQQKIDDFERDRIYCGHSIEHSLAVARMMYISVLEHGLPYSKGIIYATALLHDIGRARQYEGTMEHEEASVMIAEIVLKDCGFTGDEIVSILHAIKLHREESNDQTNSLQVLLYQMDKQSRNCFCCEAAESCKWTKERRNIEIII